MSVAKVVGYLFVLSGCSGLGIWYSQQLQKRVLHMKEMIRILDMVSSEISYSHSTLPECCEKVSEKAMEPYGEIFRNICEHIRGNSGISFDSVCKQCLTDGMQKLPLKEEKDVFIKSFVDVGFSDSWMQNRNIERGSRDLRGILDREEEELKKRSKLAVSLGAMSGILLVLILM